MLARGAHFTCTDAAAGFASGPSRLNTVRILQLPPQPAAHMPRRRMIGRGKQERDPHFAQCLRAASSSSGGRSMRMPSPSSKSALPHLLEIDRLPCLATRTPAPATTNAAMVEMLKVSGPSPPVPQAYRGAGSPSGSPVSKGCAKAPHGAREPREFCGGLALHAQGRQKRRNLYPRRRPIENYGPWLQLLASASLKEWPATTACREDRIDIVVW